MALKLNARYPLATLFPSLAPSTCQSLHCCLPRGRNCVKMMQQLIEMHVMVMAYVVKRCGPSVELKPLGDVMSTVSAEHAPTIESS